ncbi:two pore domain potassium channel family protein [Cyanobium sp. Aljojuca 7D2]|uniref:potassium channel family protein n=1 Tax=Cyanobium sp. Aljojuca 7D2 TaxID=2823698 RepID=UPI0020CBF638|nr:potassium channel family protein [Cyanobium sp. Aljojuca 7D2]MCP9892146.1 two pore domain potassium channel family protein [Cyanobium sp. Aljojuca 7D2]
MKSMLLPRHRRLAGAGGLGVLAAAAPAWGQGTPPQAPGICMGLPAQLGMAVGMLILTAIIHTLVTVIQAELTHRQRLDAWCAPRSRRRLLMILAMALLTALALWVEILLWALLYQGLGLFSGLEGSLYFSGITFTTVGYGDMTLPACWRLLSVAEAVNGVLMAGWSTAQLVYVVQRIITMRLEVEGRLPNPSGSLGGAPD